MPRPKNRITPRVERFVVAYLSHGLLHRAMIEAGYRPNHEVGQRLLRTPKIMEMIERGQAEIRKKGEYNSERAMAEAQASMDLALQTRNAMAHCKAVELRAKICGLLIERVDARLLGNFEISIKGIDDKPQILAPAQLAHILAPAQRRKDRELLEQAEEQIASTEDTPQEVDPLS